MNNIKYCLDKSNPDSFAPYVAFDMDDVANTFNEYMTQLLRDHTGNQDIPIPTLDEVWSGHAHPEYLPFSRAKLLTSEFWSSIPKCQHIDRLLKSFPGYNPMICSRLWLSYPACAELKVRWLSEHLPSVEYMLVSGEKVVDAAALVDDSQVNCMRFSKSTDKPVLVWDRRNPDFNVVEDLNMLINSRGYSDNRVAIVMYETAPGSIEHKFIPTHEAVRLIDKLAYTLATDQGYFICHALQSPYTGVAIDNLYPSDVSDAFVRLSKYNLGHRNAEHQGNQQA